MYFSLFILLCGAFVLFSLKTATRVRIKTSTFVFRGLAALFFLYVFFPSVAYCVAEPEVVKVASTVKPATSCFDNRAWEERTNLEQHVLAEQENRMTAGIGVSVTTTAIS